MTRRAIAAMTLITALALSGAAGVVSAQEPVEPTQPVEEQALAKTTTGIIESREDDVGRTVYYLRLEDGRLARLSYGPSWFWGGSHPLFAREGEELTIGGKLRDGMPNDNASETAKANAAKEPVLKVRTIDGEIRAKGKPPWSGGPKELGAVHPGYDGYSKGQANKPQKPDEPQKPDKPAKPQKPQKPDKPVKSASKSNGSK